VTFNETGGDLTGEQVRMLWGDYPGRPHGLSKMREGTRTEKGRKTKGKEIMTEGTGGNAGPFLVRLTKREGG